jgi:hypothetical protein
LCLMVDTFLRDRQTDTDAHARTFFSRHLMVCRGRFAIGPFGTIIELRLEYWHVSL